MSLIRIALVDDHRVVQTGLRSYLTSFEDIEVIGAASSGEEALAKLEEWLPDVVLMDLSMPGGMDGIEATRKVRALSPHTQVVVLTAHTDEARVVAALPQLPRFAGQTLENREFSSIFVTIPDPSLAGLRMSTGSL